MCNLFEKNVDAIEMGLALSGAEGWAIDPNGDIVTPDDVRALPDRTYPKSQAPVLMRTAAGWSFPLLRWGVRCEIKGATKPLVKFVTNARDDKLAGYTWRYSVAERRCLVPATAYYEWDGPPGGKWEVRYSFGNRPTFWMAGLWDTDPDEKTRSFTVVTTSPNELAAKIHDRMPVILDDVGAREWIGHSPLPTDRLTALCRPFPVEGMTSLSLPPPERKIKKEDIIQPPAQGELLF